MVAMPAARKFDLTFHVPVIIITGSPDTKIGYLPAARLNDVGTPCPLPPCKPPQPKIVGSSATVFINNLGCARIFDAVNDSAGAKPPGPDGCSHPSATGYKARKADHYEAIFKVEHEQSDWDVEDEFQRQDYDGTREDAAEEVSLTAGPSGSPAATPNTSGEPMSGSSASPYGGSGGGAEGSMASGSAPAVGGGGAPGKSSNRDSLDHKDEKKRAKTPIKLDLKFPLDLKIGRAGGRKGMGIGANKIALGCFTVIVG